MMVHKVFSASDIEKITGINRPRLQQWLEKGFIVPSVQVASGPGTRNTYSFDDLLKIAVMKEVVSSGIKREDAATISNIIVNENKDFYLPVSGYVCVGFQNFPEFKNSIIKKAKLCKNA